MICGIFYAYDAIESIRSRRVFRQPDIASTDDSRRADESRQANRRRHRAGL